VLVTKGIPAKRVARAIDGDIKLFTVTFPVAYVNQPLRVAKQLV
jgi:hypothetical protein